MQLGTVRPSDWRNIQVTVLLLVAVAVAVAAAGGVGGDCGGAGLLGLGVEAGGGGDDCQEDDDSEQDEGQQTSAAVQKVVFIKEKLNSKKQVVLHFKSVVGIRDILVRIRILDPYL